MRRLSSLVSVFLLTWAVSCSDEPGMKQDNLDVQNSQTPGIGCSADRVNEEYFNPNSEAGRKLQEFEAFTAQHTNALLENSRTAAGTYVIPVVFHVYGTVFSGKVVNDNTIITALQKVNDDYHGLNDDWNSVDPYFQPIRSTFNVTFKLAKKDPNGNATTGIVYHPVKNGYGNTNVDSQIAADAWDNYKYCNVYIQSELYADGDIYQSGVAWYPDVNMSNANTARIVYNGQYLYGNTDKEFASTLSHEFGHWMNLRHTFIDGCRRPNESRCSTTGDLVCDTPQATSNDACSTQTNCVGKRVNVENYMGYAGARGCYKMFTAGQVARMDAAAQHAARITLWQAGNLTATGVQ